MPITRASTKLSAVLLAMNMTQQELVERSGVSRQTVSNAYHGKEVSLDTWVRLADALNVAASEIAPAAEAARIAAVA